jgi:hypothetical protein
MRLAALNLIVTAGERVVGVKRRAKVLAWPNLNLE